jgi:isopentenyldiphosphate isomerase
MADEYIDIYDRDNILIGSMKKSQAYQQWHYVRAVILYITDNMGQILLQHRHDKSAIQSWVWDASVSGHVRAGEQPIDAIMREADEELGIVLSHDNLHYIDTYSSHGSNQYYGHNYLYTIVYEWPFEFVDGEVQQVDWFSPDQVSSIFAWDRLSHPWFPRSNEFGLIKDKLF